MPAVRRRLYRWVLLALVVLVAGLLIGAVAHQTGDKRGSRRALAPPQESGSGLAGTPFGGSCSVSVTQYGASTEAADNAAAFEKAFRAGAGGTVCVPAGTWRVTSELVIPTAETLAGAGAGRTTLLQTVADHNLLQARASNTIVEDLTLDTQTYDGGIGFSTGASHVTLRDAEVRSGSQPGHFAIYFAGPRGATRANPRYAVGNLLKDVVVSDQICDDGISWSFQKDGMIEDVSEKGSRLALYIDDQTKVDGYHYTPGPCTAQDDGYWITPPSESITIEGFVSSGAAGKICPNLSAATPCADITLEAEKAPGGTLQIGDVKGLAVEATTVAAVRIITATGVTGTWEFSTPLHAYCRGDPVEVSGLSC